MPMHNPPHPGGLVRRQCLEPLGLSVTRAANRAGLPRTYLTYLYLWYLWCTIRT